MALTKVNSRMIDDAAANVKDFGAVGDGTTDDTAAIQAAIADNLNVFFPAGSYFISDTLTVRSGCHWRGESGSVIIKTSVGAAINDTSGDNNDVWLIENLTLQGRASGGATTAGSLGIGVGRSRRSIMRNVRVNYFATGIRVDKADAAIGNYYNTFEDVLVYGQDTRGDSQTFNAVGFVIGKVGDGANANTFTRCEVYGYTETSWNLIATVGSNFNDCYSALATDALTLGTGCSNNNIIMYIEGATNAGSAAAASENNRITYYRDGSASPFVDNGYNSVSAATSLEDSAIWRNGGYQLIEFNLSKSAGASASDAFKLTLPALTSCFVDISASGVLPGVNNYLHNIRYVVHYIATTATVTEISSTNTTGVIITNSVSGNEVTFKVVNNASATGNGRFRGTVMIQGTGLDISNYARERISYEAL